MAGADAVMADVLREHAPARPILFAGESADALAAAFQGTLWSRRAAPWPPEGNFAAAVLDLPLTREAVRMAANALAARLPSGAPLFVYGANKAGIRSADGTLAQHFEAIETVAVRAHARVWRGIRKASSDGLMGALADWRKVSAIAICGRQLDWISYPGVFAHGRLDAGTALLLKHLPAAKGAKVLDFGAGTGILARALLDRGARLTLVEPDALARAAASENVPEAEIADTMPARRYDLIVSNPPIHRGKEMDLAVLNGLLAEAPQRLTPGGTVLLVTQKTIPVPRLAAAHLPHIERIADEGGYRVWQLAPKPRPV